MTMGVLDVDNCSYAASTET